jgi:hypothetical protein
VSKRLPRLWRKKRGGKYYGAWLATIDGADVSLETKDAELARKRLPAAVKGKREFESDAAAAAASSEPGLEDAGGGEAAAAAAAAPPVPLPMSPGPVVPDQIVPPQLQLPPMSPTDAQAEAEATAAAAEEVAGGAGDAANDNAGGFNLPPDAIEGLLKQGAEAIVVGQLQLQAWIIKKRFGRIVQPLPAESAQKLIDAAASAWVVQLEQWFPDIKSCPPWLIAVGAPLLLLPAQLQNSVPDPDAKPEKQGQEPTAQAAA